MNKEILAETKREIESWPDVSLSQENAGKHGKIVLHYKGESRIVIVANTPSDIRALKNHIGIVRKELRGLGAVRNKVVASQTQRERNKPQRVEMPTVAAPVLRNPFEQLKGPEKMNTIEQIFAGIEKLRYAEMLEFCEILRDASEEIGLKRKDVYLWAKTMQRATEFKTDAS